MTQVSGSSENLTKDGNNNWIATHLSEVSPIAIDSFDNRTVVGKGKFGIVFLSQHKVSKKCVAIKFIPKKIIFECQSADRINQEMEILSRIRNPFIVQYFGAFNAPNVVGLVFEFVFGGELYNRMKRVHRLPETECLFYFCEIASGLNYLHDLNIVFRDLKPENILLDKEGHIKICDFGFATFTGSKVDSLQDGCGTAMYVAPEIAGGSSKQRHGKPVDWWALGCILYEMLVGTAPFGDTDNKSKFEIFNNINAGNFSMPMHGSADVKGIIKGLLVVNAEARMNWKGIKESPWTSTIDWTQLVNRKYRPPWVPNMGKEPSNENFLDWKNVALPPATLSAQAVDYCNQNLVIPQNTGMLRKSSTSKTSSEVDLLAKKASVGKVKKVDSTASLTDAKRASVSSILGEDLSEDQGNIVRTKTKSPQRKTQLLKAA